MTTDKTKKIIKSKRGKLEKEIKNLLDEKICNN